MTYVSGNKIGHFMIAVGALIENRKTGKFLISKRTDETHHTDTWEITYGRIDQHEELDQALKREVKEETGLTELEIVKINRIWHIYRGEKSADKEVYGISFHCLTDQTDVTLSSEHSAYQWVTLEEAIELVEVEGIKNDLRFFRDHLQDTAISISDTQDKTLYTLNAQP